jgi:hypothetical protein
LVGPSCPERASAIIRYGLAPHAQGLERLHRKLARRIIPTLPTKSGGSIILQRISAGCASLEVASLINRSLMAYVSSRNARIKALRCSKVLWFTDDKTSWPLVEWVEDNGTSNLAIFHIEDPNEPRQGSWLMHSGLGVSDEASKNRCWENSRIDWDVADIDHLKTLFGVAQHVAGMLEWSVADAMKLYYERNTEEESASEYISLGIR